MFSFGTKFQRETWRMDGLTFLIMLGALATVVAVSIIVTPGSESSHESD